MTGEIQEVEVRFSPAPNRSSIVGILALHKKRLYFEYDAAWLQKGRELSPFILPCKPGLIEHSSHEFGPLFGLFDDSLPDGWGLLLMDRYFRRQGMDLSTVSPLDRLLYLGSNTMGALTYHPASCQDNREAPPLNLHELAAQSRDVYEGPETEVPPLLLRTGGSPGGARPKVLIGYNRRKQVLIAGEGDLPEDFEHWLVKFPTREDGPDAGPVEFAYAMMAGKAGIHIPECRLFQGGGGEYFFGVKRFDRQNGNRRLHVHTFGNLIQANFRIPSCDYNDLFKVTTLLTRNHDDLLQAFRLMLFNVLTHNRDDHVKNFSFILDAQRGSWRLTPAYDLTFARGPGGEQSMTVDGVGRGITRRHCLGLADKYDISIRESKRIIGEVEEVVAQWPDFTEAANVGSKTTAKISDLLGTIRREWLRQR
jgi:serine/threonine-protein kinase HipA